MISAAPSTHLLWPRHRRSAVRRWPGRSRRLLLFVGADAYSGPLPGTTIDRYGRGSVPARSSGFDGYCNRLCRGRPVCRPLHVSMRKPFTGGHIGPPLRNAESVPEPTGIGVKRTLRGGAEPAPCSEMDGGFTLGRGTKGRAAGSSAPTGGCGKIYRPPGTGERHAGSSCPTWESPGRGAPSCFPAQAPERIEIIFRRGVYVAKNTSHGATCERGPSQWDGPLLRQSGV